MATRILLSLLVTLLAFLAETRAADSDAQFLPLQSNLQAVEGAIRSQKGAETANQPLLSKVQAALQKKNIFAMEELLEKSVFCIVTINPEGRVKVARGPAELPMVQGQPAFALVQVFNQSGGQQTIAPHSTYVGAGKNPFEVAIVQTTNNPHPLSAALTGAEMEYRLLSLKCSTAGKREVTLHWNAGQGTQDIGFRGEVSFLLNVVPRPTK